MASERRHASQFFPLSPLAGFLSGLLTVGLGNSFGKLGIYGIGSVFGAMMGIALAITKMLPGGLEGNSSDRASGNRVCCFSSRGRVSWDAQ